MVGHTIEAKSDGDGYAISVDTDLAMQVKTEASGKRQTIANVSGLVDVGKLQASRYVQIINTLEFQVKRNKFIPSYPTVWVKMPILLKKGDFRKVA